MKAQFLSLYFIVLLTVLSQNASSSAIGREDLKSMLVKPSETSLVPLRRSVRAVDIFDLTRAIIDGVIANLENAATTASQTLGSLMSLVDDQTLRFTATLNKTLITLSNGIEDAVQEALDSGEIVVISVIECANQQQIIAEMLINNTLTNVTQCVSNALGDIQLLFSGASDLATAAIEAASNVSSEATACGVANFANFYQVGACLNGVLGSAQNQANALVLRLTALTTHAVGLVTSAPINFALCATVRLSNAALAGVNIIKDIGKCTADAVSSVPRIE